MPEREYWERYGPFLAAAFTGLEGVTSLRGGLGQVLAFSGAGSLVSLKLPLSILPSLFALFHAGFSLVPPFLAAAFTGLEGVTSLRGGLGQVLAGFSVEPIFKALLRLY
jgi:hypothetical protein